MGTSPVDIVNMAVGQLGDLSSIKRMTAFTRAGCGQSAVMNAAYDFYNEAKESMLAALDWPCCRAVIALVLHSDSPILSGRWNYKYVRPPDCLILRKVVDTDDDANEYEEMTEPAADPADATRRLYTRFILTNLENAYARYTYSVSEAAYGVGMAKLHALYLAEDIAMTITGNPAKSLIVTQKLRADAQRLCLTLGSKEGYVEDEQGERELTDLY